MGFVIFTLSNNEHFNDGMLTGLGAFTGISVLCVPTSAWSPPLTDSYWCVAVHVPAAADGRAQATQVDGCQTLL